MPGELQDGGRRKLWTVTIHKSCRSRLFFWLEVMTTGRDCQLNCGAVIEDCVAKPNMICGCADGYKISVAIEVSVMERFFDDLTCNVWNFTASFTGLEVEAPCC